MKLAFSIMFLGILLKYSTAIECYACADCKIPFDEDDDGVNRIECDSTSCMKLNITHTTHTHMLTIVSRGCATYGMQEEQCVTTSVSGTYSRTCYCNSDSCNGGSSMTIALRLEEFAFITTASLFLMKLVSL